MNKLSLGVPNWDSAETNARTTCDAAVAMSVTSVARAVRLAARYVFKPTLAEGKNSVVSRTMGSKLVKMIYKAGPWGGSAVLRRSSCMIQFQAVRFMALHAPRRKRIPPCGKPV